MKKIIILASLVFAAHSAIAEQAVQIVFNALNIRNGVTNVVGTRTKTVTDTNRVNGFVSAATNAFPNKNRMDAGMLLIIRALSEKIEANESDNENVALRQFIEDANARVRTKIWNEQADEDAADRETP